MIHEALNMNDLKCIKLGSLLHAYYLVYSLIYQHEALEHVIFGNCGTPDKYVHKFLIYNYKYAVAEICAGRK